MNVEVKVLFFAKAREVAGKSCDILSVSSPISYLQLLEEIVTTYSLADIKRNIILAVNEEYCNLDTTIYLKPGDEIAVIPPLSGG
ncbi:hypothetical protein NQ314_019286 [Rhamnusium bicolor]|uniref:Molybdopterin synthase sulfur carrier subunit n=1 Tax=Rhamnusium bicolor TaxID=1586634 RepID=A0AAV8WPK6_9CUCU|nr:hypothetical protein NQ314_019286 [Rhamnusium bicolor]